MQCSAGGRVSDTGPRARKSHRVVGGQPLPSSPCTSEAKAQLKWVPRGIRPLSQGHKTWGDGVIRGPWIIWRCPVPSRPVDQGEWMAAKLEVAHWTTLRATSQHPSCPLQVSEFGETRIHCSTTFHGPTNPKGSQLVGHDSFRVKRPHHRGRITDIYTTVHNSCKITITK